MVRDSDEEANADASHPRRGPGMGGYEPLVAISGSGTILPERG